MATHGGPLGERALPSMALPRSTHVGRMVGPPRRGGRHGLRMASCWRTMAARSASGPYQAGLYRAAPMWAVLVVPHGRAASPRRPPWTANGELLANHGGPLGERALPRMAPPLSTHVGRIGRAASPRRPPWAANGGLLANHGGPLGERALPSGTPPLSTHVGRMVGSPRRGGRHWPRMKCHCHRQNLFCACLDFPHFSLRGARRREIIAK